MKLSCTIVWTFRFLEQQENMKDLRNMDASLFHHGLKHIHSWNLLKTTSTLSIAPFAPKKWAANTKLWGMEGVTLTVRCHKNFTQSLQNQSKIQDDNSPQLRQKVSFLQLW